MKLKLLFMVMDVLTLLAYPVLYVHSKLSSHAVQTR